MSRAIKKTTKLGAAIRTARLQRGWSQSALARYIGVTSKSVADYEADRIHPSVEALFRLALVLGLDLNAMAIGSRNHESS